MGSISLRLRHPLNILFCIKALGNRGGGAERVFTTVANGLAERGHRVTVLTFERGDTPTFYPLSDRVARIGLASGSPSRRARAGETVQRLFRLRQSVKAVDPDIVVGFMHSSYVLLGLALFGTGRKLIASEHNVPARYADRRLEWGLIQLMPALASRMTAVSEQARSEYPTRLQGFMVPVANPVMEPAAGRADAKGGRKKHLLAVGRLHEQKDHETLIAAFATLSAEFPEWALRIIGEGERRTDLQALINDHGLSDRIILAGTTAEISTEYLAAQIFVTSSRYESFGLATAEAFAHGLPAIGFSDCPGTNELIIDGLNGILVAPGDDRVAALSGALRRLMASSDERCRLAAGAAPSLGRHRPENVTRAWEELLYQTLD